MANREEILRQIRNGQQMVVGNGQAIRPIGNPAEDGVPVKQHGWGRHA